MRLPIPETDIPSFYLLALNSSYTHTNLAVRCLTKALCAHGFAAGFGEFNLKDQRRRILEALVNAKAEVYGFSSYIWNIRELLSLAADLKAVRPDAVIFFGGPEVSFDTDELLASHPFIDHILVGEGESAVVTLAETLARGEVPPRVIDGGVYAGFPEQGMVYTPEEMRGSGARMLYYESSRGCPFRCAYCLSSLSGKVRAKPADVTLAELAEFETLDADIKVIKFVDRTFNFDRERAKAIWRGLLDKRFTKCYHFEICAELLDEESIEILAAFPKGKVQLEIGVQSINPDTLAAVSRRTDTDRLLAVIERLHSLGNMHIHADLIAGLPRETMETFAAAFDALYGRCDMLQLGFLKLLRGSALRRDAESFGCVYSAEPPYTVLATDSMSFADLSLLHDIDDLSERFGGEGFQRGRALVMAREQSPFAVYQRLAEGFRKAGLRVRELSQPRAYEAFFSLMGGGRELAEALCADWLCTQKTPPPAFDGLGLRRVQDDDARRAFIDWAEEAGEVCFAPALEVWRGSVTLIADRRSQLVWRANGKEFVKI
ncbi:MAG: DUF4080 domain-containing protein [Clostridia bacterium]|nr:DUF4080 domain-containing protein [Clostridia bacterium]